MSLKVFSVVGFSGSGKTTTIELLIPELKKRGFRVGTVKEIHNEAFALDANPNGNTARHRAAGAELVVARGLRETDVMFPEKLEMERILLFFEGFDYAILEGVRDIDVPLVAAADCEARLEDIWSEHVFCVSGRVADGLGQYKGIPAISAIGEAAGLADCVERYFKARRP